MTSLTRFAAACGLLAFALAWPHVAQAEPERVRLSLVRAEGAEACFEAAELGARVTARLGRDPFATDAARSIEAVMTRDAKGFAAHIFVRTRGASTGGGRDLSSEAADCHALEDAVTLAVALAIDPEAALHPPPPPAPPIQPPPVQAPLPACPVVPERVCPPPRAPETPAPREPDRAQVTTRLVLAFGPLPSPAPGIEVSAVAHLALEGRLSATASALWLPEQRTSDRRVGFGLGALSLGACVDPARVDSAWLTLCGGLLAGSVHAVPYAFDPTNPGERPFVGARVGARGALRILGPLFVEAGLDAAAPFSHYEFTVRNIGVVFEQTPVFALASLGLGLSL